MIVKYELSNLFLHIVLSRLYAKYENVSDGTQTASLGYQSVCVLNKHNT